jgi:hypothetical protein
MVLYPVLLLAFGMLNGLHQSLFAICFPILKLVLKNWASHGMYRREDLAPAHIVLLVDVFHSLHDAVGRVEWHAGIDHEYRRFPERRRGRGSAIDLEAARATPCEIISTNTAPTASTGHDKRAIACKCHARVTTAHPRRSYGCNGSPSSTMPRATSVAAISS